MRISKRAGANAIAVCSLFLSGCQKERHEAQAEPKAQSENKTSSSGVTLTMKAQAEQNIQIAPVETGVAVLPQRAKGRIALPDNATWRVGVLTEGRVEKVYFNLGDSVQKGQVLARMHSHDVHETRANYANAVAEQSRLQAAEALAQKNYERSQRLYELKAESLAQTECDSRSWEQCPPRRGTPFLKSSEFDRTPRRTMAKMLT